MSEDTTLSRSTQLVGAAAATTPLIGKIEGRVSGVFVTAVIWIAVLTMIVWLIAGQSFGFAVARAVSVLVSSCPCALGLATPVAIMVGSGMGARDGIMFKTAVSLEEAGKMEIVALDKTGTITSGEPKVTDLLPAEGVSEEELLSLAYALERKSEHPLAKAILALAEEREIEAGEVKDFQAVPGNGLSAVLQEEELYGGNLIFIRKHAKVPEDLRKAAERFAEDGKTPQLFSINGRVNGVSA